jgi:tryptophanyl-tRNA synthetase
MSKQVILTGLRTNAEYHLGNYLGALMPMVRKAKDHAGEFQINLFAPDLHSFTTPICYAKFYDQTIQNLKLFIACGFPVEHADVYIYRQSFIPAHSELSWILSNFTGWGEMARMVEFKDKAARLSEDRVSVGLFSYPILMAADILLYGASYVPVGEDQRQHLEFTRDIATRMNNQFGELFVVPEPLAKQQAFFDRDNAPRIRSLRDPSKKMSKSIDDPSGTIQLSDSQDDARKKIMKAETDNSGIINFDWDKQPGISNLLQMVALLSGQPQAEVNQAWQGKQSYGDLKLAVADLVCKCLDDIQSSMQTVSEEMLMAKLLPSEQAMSQIANTTLLRVQQAVGLRPKV